MKLPARSLWVGKRREEEELSAFTGGGLKKLKRPKSSQAGCSRARNPQEEIRGL